MNRPVGGPMRFATVWAATLWVGLLFVIAWLAPSIATHDPSLIDIPNALASPSAAHWMGTDQLGRDVFSRMVFGARISLAVGFVAVGIATLTGILIGAAAGYFGGRTDRILMTAVDVMLCFPTLFLILAVIAYLDPSITNIMIIIGLTGWMGTARLIRAEILTLREREFVLASRALGASHARILARHLIPNAMGPVFVTAILGVGSAILVESALSFLGLGVQPPVPSWGNILTYGKESLGVAWWLMLYPGVAVLLTVLGYYLIGEGLRDALRVRRGSRHA